MSETERGARAKDAATPARVQSLPKRFYKTVTVAPEAPRAPAETCRTSAVEAPPPTPAPSPPGGGGQVAEGGAPNPGPLPAGGERGQAARGSMEWRGTAGAAQSFHVLLDSRPMRTPAKREFALPTHALADAIAAEWAAQGERIDPLTMPLTKLANSAIDGVAARADEVRADIAKYAASDLLCYRASHPPELARRQADAWDPILAWSAAVLGLRLTVAEGLMPVEQPEEAPAILARRLEAFDAFALAAVHVMTTLMGSALLAVAHAERQLDVRAAWSAAHVDEDFQAEKWGIDAEAQARRDRRWSEMAAASRMLDLLGRD